MNLQFIYIKQSELTVLKIKAMNKVEIEYNTVIIFN